MILGIDWGASWSPDGSKILFAAAPAPGDLPAIWVINPDGSGLHQIPIAPACGGPASGPASVGCLQPGWSPDGTKIVFTRITANGTQRNIYTVNAGGTGLSPVTTSGSADTPDWGPHPLAD